MHQGIKEKDVNLLLAQRVGAALKNYNVELVYTRYGDVTVPLERRVAIANQSGADLFLSLHFNAGGGSGFESYVAAGAYERTLAYRETIHREVALYLAAYNLPDRGMKTRDLYVLEHTRMPAVLLECLFLDHPTDRALLRDNAFFGGLAGAVARGVVQALGVEGDPCAGLRARVGQLEREVARYRQALVAVRDAAAAALRQG